jgi:AcrR family transcriptional regulator
MSESQLPSGGMRRKPRQARSQERVNRILDVAEELFASQGYVLTTTNEIAAQAQVAIGSLYQFFPDKSAILKALALRYTEVLHQQLTTMEEAEPATLPLIDYVDRLIDTTEQFFIQNPGYHAIFMEIQETTPELIAIEEAADAKLIRDWAGWLDKRYPGLATEDYAAISFVLVKAIGTLLWLSHSKENPFRLRLIAETKRLILSYLQSHFSSTATLANGKRKGI